MADLKDDVKHALTQTSVSDVVSAGSRAMRKVESGLHSGLSKARKFVSDRVPESVKSAYREARGYRVRPRTQTRSR